MHISVRSLRTLFARCAAITLSALALWSTAHAETPYDRINADAASLPVAVSHVRGDISVIAGSGGNIGVLAGPDGLLLVDAGIAVSKTKILDALHAIKNGPIKLLIDTHWHWDHTDGNAWVHAQGAAIVGTPETVRRLSETIRIEEWGDTFTPLPPEALPTILVTGRKIVTFDGEELVLRAYGPGHTDTDLSVYFPKEDVLQTGDVMWNGFYPFIDYVTGGSIDGAITAADATLKLVTPHTLIIPGHGPVGGRADLVAFRDMLVAIRAKVAALKYHGASLADVIAAHPTAAFDAQYSHGVIGPTLFTTLVYRGIH